MIDPGSKRMRWIIGLVGFISAAYFHQWNGGWNVNTRLDLTYAIVDEHRLTIDTFHDATGYDTNDKAEFDGHFYSDKAIGTALAAVPVYQVARWLGIPLNAQTKRYLCRTLTVSVSFGLLLVVLISLLRHQGIHEHHACAIALMGGLGTMLFPYSTVFYPYAPACLFAMLSYRLLLPDQPEQDLSPLPTKRIILAGLAMGISLLFEYLFGLIAIAMVIHLFASVGSIRRRITIAAIYTLFSLIALLPFFIYTFAIFGKPTIPYEYEFDPFFRDSMAQGLAGIHFPPKLGILWLITFHPFRGLFVYSPLLLFTGLGLIAMLGIPNGTRRAGMILTLFIAYLVVNGGYYHQWWGGRACGPRFLIPVIPFLILPIAVVWGRWPRLRLPIVILGIVSIILQLLAAGIDPQPPIHTLQADTTGYLLPGTLDRPYFSPLVWVYLPALKAGQVAWNPIWHVGVPGVVSWLPLIALWCAVGIWIWRRDVKCEKAVCAESLKS